jgi:hypothetical protein
MQTHTPGTESEGIGQFHCDVTRLETVKSKGAVKQPYYREIGRVASHLLR